MKRLLAVLVVMMLCGCTLAEVNVQVAGERTSLEKQVLGSYNALTRRAMLSSSVRGVDPLGNVEEPPTLSADGQAALEAVQTQAFHADDVDAFRRLGWVGENNEGLLTPFPMEREGAPDALAGFAADYREDEFALVVREVNEARDTLIRRVVQTDDAFTEADLPQIRGVFARMNARRALPGERIQQPDGQWTRK